MNIPLIIKTIEEIINNASQFSLDQHNNTTHQEILSNIRSIVNDLNYNPNSQSLYFESFSITDKEQENELLLLLHKAYNYMCVINPLYTPTPSSPNETNDYRASLMNSVINPIFTQRYGFSLIPELSTEEFQNTPNLITWHTRLSNRENMGFESNLNRTGVYMRNYPSMDVRQGDLHTFSAHGRKGELAYKRHDMSGITPQGGDILPLVCFQGTETILPLLGYLHRATPPTDTGIIHLKRNEPLNVLRLPINQMGIMIFGSSRRKVSENKPPNPFMHTTLRGTTPLSSTTRVYNTTGRTQVSLQISPDGNRMYFGQYPNFFGNRNKLLNQEFQNKLQELRRLDPFNAHLPRYHINFDFNCVTPEIGESDIIYFFGELKSPQNYIHFYKQFIDPVTQNVNYDKLNFFFTYPEEYHKMYTPHEGSFIPYEDRTCIWINKPVEQHQSQSNHATNSFAERMTIRTIERSELDARTNRQLATSNTPERSRRNRNKLKRSHSFS